MGLSTKMMNVNKNIIQFDDMFLLTISRNRLLFDMKKV